MKLRALAGHFYFESFYFFFGPGLPRRVPSFFKRRPCASRGALLPGFGPRFLGAALDVVLAVFLAVDVLFLDPAGRPRFFGADVDFLAGALVAFVVLFFDPAGRPRFFGAADLTAFVVFDLSLIHI